MIGGGFGGSVLALIPVDGIKNVVDAEETDFHRRGWAEPAHWTMAASPGLHPISS